MKIKEEGQYKAQFILNVAQYMFYALIPINIGLTNMLQLSNNMNYQSGLIKQIVLVVAGLTLLAYLGLNLREITNSATFTDNWNFIVETISSIWTNYLRTPLSYIFFKLLIPYIWNPLIDLIKSKI